MQLVQSDLILNTYTFFVHSQDSIVNMWDQMKGVQAKIQSFVDSAPDGVHMICYSQGEDVWESAFVSRRIRYAATCVFCTFVYGMSQIASTCNSVKGQVCH